MILPFMTHWPKTMPEHFVGKPTYFVEKINNGLVSSGMVYQNDIDKYEQYLYPQKFGCHLIDVPQYERKFHTIRADKGNRWKAGNDIHFYINCRQKNMFQFAPVVKCKSVQAIKIVHSGESWRMPWVIINGSILIAPEIRQLAINDGFENTTDFFRYFNTDFTGKIIHWTDVTY